MTNTKPWLKKKGSKVIEVMGAKVTLKPISFGDSRNAVAQCIDIDPMTKKTKVDATLLGVLRTIAQIEDWELTDDNGNKLPVTLETFDESLDENFASEIVRKVQEASDQGVTEAEKKE